MTHSYLPHVGEFRGGALVLAVHGHGEYDRTGGVMLGYLNDVYACGGRYVVWTVAPGGSLKDPHHEYEQAAALRVYSERVMARLFRYYNLKAPALTYLGPNTDRST